MPGNLIFDSRIRSIRHLGSCRGSASWEICWEICFGMVHGPMKLLPPSLLLLWNRHITVHTYIYIYIYIYTHIYIHIYIYIYIYLYTSVYYYDVAVLQKWNLPIQASSCRAKRWKWPALTLSWTCPELVPWQGTDSLELPNGFRLPWFCHDFAMMFHFNSYIFHGFPLYWRPLWTDSSSKSMLITMAVGISFILVLTTLQMDKRSGSTAVHMSITSSIFNIDYSECRHCSHSYAILESVDSPSITMGTCWVFPF